jgi:hypothetical protein
MPILNRWLSSVRGEVWPALFSFLPLTTGNNWRWGISQVSPWRDKTKNIYLFQAVITAFAADTAPSLMAMKENPRKRPRVPPNSATREVSG